MKHICPICKKPIELLQDGHCDKEKFLPFCFERCKLIDLGAWFQEEYRLSRTLQSGQPADISDEKDGFGFRKD